MRIFRDKSLYKISKLDLVKMLLSAIFIVLVLVPLIIMFSYMDGKSFQKVITSSGFMNALKNSIISTTVSTVITISLAMMAAFSIERIKISYKSIFKVLLTLPMLVPSISLGMGLIILFGNNGILTRIFRMDSGIYGFTGIIMGSVLYAFPVAFIMLSEIMKYEDGTSYEAAEVLGISKYQQFKTITLPYMKKTLINVIFTIFTLIITDYGVPLMIGGKYSTIPVIMYQEVIGQLNFGKGCIYGSVLLIPAVLAFVIDLKNQDKGKLTYITKEYNLQDNISSKIVGYIICTVCGLYVLMPVISFILLGFTKQYPMDLSWSAEHLFRTMDFKAGIYFVNSIVIALAVSIIGVVIAFFTAYLSARVKSKVSRFLHLVSMTSAAIPGIVLGLAYVLTFKKTAIYGTIIILVMVNLVHFISAPYLMMYNSLIKINENIEYVGQTMGISRFNLMKDVFIPVCGNTLIEMFSYFFVNCMMTISAVSFLANTFNKPVALMINQFEAQMQLECAAIVSLMILCTNVFLKIILNTIKKRIY